jgi:hypothetical protein
VAAALGHSTAIQDQDAIGLAQRFGDKTLMFGQDRRIVPRAFADELLQRPHLTCCLRPCAQQPQRHRLDVLARHVGNEQAT